MSCPSFFFDSKKLEELGESLFYELSNKYVLLGQGKGRIVFDKGNGTVVKLAFNHEGLSESAQEVIVSRRQKEEELFVPIAECDWNYDDESGLTMIMEKVEMLTGKEKTGLPDWVGYVDCGQVGYNHAGKLVAFDL